MSTYQDCLRANAEYGQAFDRSKLAMPPAKRLAVVACMDARLAVEEFLGLQTGDAHIIRNAGGIVTDDELRSLIISHKLLGTQEFFVINHTDCGMLTFSDQELQQRLKEETGEETATLRFYAFKDLEQNVREQVGKIRGCPFIPKEIPVYGFIYDVTSGRLREVK